MMQKGSSFAMVSILLTIYYLKPVLSELKNYKKSTVGLVLLIFALSIYLTYNENSKLNNQNLLDLQSGSAAEIKYDNKGSFDLIYSTKPDELFIFHIKMSTITLQ